MCLDISFEEPPCPSWALVDVLNAAGVVADVGNDRVIVEYLAVRGSNTLRPNNNGRDPNRSGPVSARLNQYFNVSTFSQPAPFTFGNVTRTLPNVPAPGTQNIDASLFKNFNFYENLSMQVRANPLTY